MLRESIPIRGGARTSFQIRLVIRHVLVATSSSYDAVIACVAWALTDSDGELIFDEQFYVVPSMHSRGLEAMKNQMHTGNYQTSPPNGPRRCLGSSPRTSLLRYLR